MIKQFIKLSAVAALAFAFVVAPVASAVSGPVTGTPTTWTEYPFTTGELTNWTPDRTAPSGGASSVNYASRNNVLRMGVDSSAQNTTDGTYYFTEGLKRDVTATALRADLYVESSWTDSTPTKVSAGLWGVGNDADGEISAYPIVQYTTSGVGGYVGWRTFNDAVGGWNNLPDIEVNEDGWNTLEIKYNSTTKLFDFTINGEAAGSSVAPDSIDLDEVILNSYNFGGENEDYLVHWSKFASGIIGSKATLTSKDQCKDGNWSVYSDSKKDGFKNQGQCVSYVTANENSKAKRETSTTLRY